MSESDPPDPLVERARAAALGAYAPYSRFSVGCAIESVDGEVAVGANMENACYRLGVCAEISALTAAQQAFGLKRIARIAVAGGNAEGGDLRGEGVVTPCGGCRQAILEAAHVSGRDLEVVSVNGDGSETRSARISELIPHGFGPANLEDAGGQVRPGRSLVAAALTGFHRLRLVLWRLRGARGRGVLAVPLTPEGRLVLVRLTYAPGWRLPGGGVKRGEDPRGAALRELSEEIGMTAHGEIAEIDEFEHGPGDRGISTLFLVRDVRYAPRRTYEVDEVDAFAPGSLPPDATPLTKAKVALALPLIRPA